MRAGFELARVADANALERPAGVSGGEVDERPDRAAALRVELPHLDAAVISPPGGSVEGALAVVLVVVLVFERQTERTVPEERVRGAVVEREPRVFLLVIPA